MPRRRKMDRDEIEDALRAVRAAAPGSRVIVDLPRQRIEIWLPGDSAEPDDENPWEEDYGATQV